MRLFPILLLRFYQWMILARVFSVTEYIFSDFSPDRLIKLGIYLSLKEIIVRLGIWSRKIMWIQMI